MRRKIEIALMVAIVCIAVFLATFGTFFYLKEKDCAVNLYSAACYRTYPQFLEMLVELK